MESTNLINLFLFSRGIYFAKEGGFKKIKYPRNWTFFIESNSKISRFAKLNARYDVINFKFAKYLTAKL